MRYVTALAACLALAIDSTANGVEIDLFNRDRIGFTNGQSREIQQTVDFPDFGPNDRLTLNWDVLGDADPWDRSGSIHAILPSGEQVQLGKFITGFNGTTSHSQDLSRLAPLLSGQTLQVEAHIDTWVVDAWRINASIDVQPGANAEANPVWAAPALSRDPRFGWDGSGRQRKSAQVDVPEGLDRVTLSYFASGHHHTQTSNSDEFNERRHRLYVDGVQVWTDVPWRTDGPNFRNVNPTSGRWDGNGDGDANDPYPIDIWSSDFPRSGWVPGDEVAPYLIDVTDYVDPGSTHTIALTIDGVDINSYWRVSAFLSGTAAPVTALPGDFNFDGVVDAADYTVWRDAVGQSGDNLPADANADGVVDARDYTQWRGRYGLVAAVAVPEPASVSLLLGLLIARGTRTRIRG